MEPIGEPAGISADRQQFTYDGVEVTPDLSIPMKDGRSLSARLWLPKTAREQPVPALVEYCPFRHADFSYPRDALIHPWFAKHGYASLRLEPAGSLDSSGAPQDEYVSREQSDGAEALEWISRQHWCCGKTGMFGMSWGAFSALQVAALRPPSLKAIIPVHGSDDRFADDIHYMGGCLLTAGLAWGALYQTYMMRPPSRRGQQEDWRADWYARMEAAPNVLEEWLNHQSRDDYWRHGSISEDYGRINVPALVISGWADGYSSAALRMMDRLGPSTRAIIGPWTHAYPHLASPGPRMDFLGEAKRWWDRWLLGHENGAEDIPKLRYFLQDSVAPQSSYQTRPGRWCSAQTWPPASTRESELYLNAGKLDPAPVPGPLISVSTPLDNDIDGWEWLPHGVGPEMPGDQTVHDAGALIFDGPSLEDGLVIAGAPRVLLPLQPTSEIGHVLVRLSEVARDGRATLLSYGLANLSDANHRADELIVSLRFGDIAQRIGVGHRLRLSISTECWPLVWPSVHRLKIGLVPGAARLYLPVLASEKPCVPGEISEEVAWPKPPMISYQRPPKREITVSRDDQGKATRHAQRDDGAFEVLENGRRVDACGSLTFQCERSDPLSAEVLLRYSLILGDAGKTAKINSRTRITADARSFKLEMHLSAHDEGDKIFDRQICTSVPRTRI